MDSDWPSVRRFVLRTATSLGAVLAVAGAVHLASGLGASAALAIGAALAVLAATWIAIGGVQAPGDISAPSVSAGGLAGNASQGLMVAQHEVLLQEHMQYVRSPRNQLELLRGQLPPEHPRTPSWARPLITAAVIAATVACALALAS